MLVAIPNNLSLSSIPHNERQAKATATLMNTLIVNNQLQYFDAIYLLATVNTNNTSQSRSIDSLRNYISSSYTATETGTPNWLLGYGFYGNGGGSIFLSLINPATGGLNFSLNDAHISFYNRDNITGGIELGCLNAGTGAGVFAASKYSDGKTYLRLNSATSLDCGAAGDCRGWFLGERTGVNTITMYKNGSSIATTGANASTAIPNFAMYALATNSSGAVFGTSQSAKKMALCTVGKSGMNRTIVYNAFNQYLTDIGYPLL
jgi:hypothetical protein